MKILLMKRGGIQMLNNSVTLLEWASMETCMEYVLRNHAGSTPSKMTAQVKILENKYHAELEERIAACELQAQEIKDALLCYVLGELYFRNEKDIESNYERLKMRLWLLRSLRLDKKNASAWYLLGKYYAWRSWIEGAIGSTTSEYPRLFVWEARPKRQKFNSFKAIDMIQLRRIRFIDKAIKYINKALALEPGNKKYSRRLEYCYKQRKQELE
jgi:hypothetical protein